MPTDLVKVQFKNRDTDEYGGTEYSYIADVPLAVGDIVTVPTRRGESQVRVSKVDVPDSECGYPREKLSHITQAPSSTGIFDEFFSFVQKVILL